MLTLGHNSDMISWLFLVVTLVGAWFTFNAYLPVRARGPLIGGSFFAGWLTSELSIHHFAWQVAATLGFVAFGALEAWPGWLGLLVTLASWAGLYGLAVQASRSAPALEHALEQGLGEAYRSEIPAEVWPSLEQPLRPGRRLVPFLMLDPDVKRIGGISYAPEHGFRGELDIYVPKSGARNAPVLFQIHGGGWTISQKGHQALPLMLQLARAGWVCVAANYRLSPKATWPDHLVDLKRALGWIRENIAEYGGDPDTVAVTGGSAGGHLSAMMALTANDPEYQPGFEDVDTSVTAAVPFYGVYDFSDAYGLHLHDGMPLFLENLVMKSSLETHREEWQKASPMHRITPDAPPFFVIHGTHDSLTPIEEARHFVELMRKTSQQPVCFAEIPGAQHAFETFYSLRTEHVVRGVERFLAWIVARKKAQAPSPSEVNTTITT